MRKLIIISLIVLLALNRLSAQKPVTGSKLATLRTQILEGETFKPVSFANVLSLKSKKGTICGFDGFFEMPLDITDTLVVSSVGYEKEYVPVAQIAKSDGTYFPIRLMNKTYHIATVNIYELRWQKFKDEFKAMDMPKWAGNKYYWLESLLSPEELEEIRTMPLPTPGIPIGLTTTHYQKQLAAVAELEAQAKIDKKIEEKYNPELVAQITGIQDEEELIDFIVYCDFSRVYLMSARTVDIISRIKMNYEQFCYDKENGRLPDYHPVKRVYTY